MVLCVSCGDKTVPAKTLTAGQNSLRKMQGFAGARVGKLSKLSLHN